MITNKTRSTNCSHTQIITRWFKRGTGPGSTLFSGSGHTSSFVLKRVRSATNFDRTQHTRRVTKSRAPLVTPSPAMAMAPTLLTGERLVVFLFASRVALAAPAYLAAPLVVLAAAALAVELAVDGSASASSPLRLFKTRCALVRPIL